MSKQKITSFTDLTTWKTAHRFVLRIYKTTRGFPVEEKYALINQLKRAVVSITSNIAEGFYRRTSRDKIHFYYTALSSLGEIQNQLTICKDLDYIKEIESRELFKETIIIRKLLNGLIKYAVFSMKNSLRSFAFCAEYYIHNTKYSILSSKV